MKKKMNPATRNPSDGRFSMAGVTPAKMLISEVMV